LEYRLIKELWAFMGDRIAVRFVYESRDATGQRWRSHGNENWRFDADAYMAERHAKRSLRPQTLPTIARVNSRAGASFPWRVSLRRKQYSSWPEQLSVRRRRWHQLRGEIERE
jgi:nuclear transport factor 2 (NTF2) superfamily protein